MENIRNPHMTLKSLQIGRKSPLFEKNMAHEKRTKIVGGAGKLYLAFKNSICKPKNTIQI